MAKHTLKKFVRTDAPGRLRIQPRDAALLRDLASFRFLNTAQILALHPGNRNHFQHRLALLYHAGYVDRPAGQKAFNLPSDHLIYALGRKGAEIALADERDRKLWSGLNSRISSPNLAHALMVSQFRAVLTLALQKNGGEIARWFQGYGLKNELTLNRRAPAIVPDGFFTLKLAGKQWHFFLEADRSTMNHHRYLSKLQAYWKWFAEKTYSTHLKMENFRVLTIADTAGRRDNLRTTAKNADPRRSGSGLFLFACEKDYSLQKPEAILSPIWLSAKDDGRHSLTE